ncbi:MAG: Bax inhibitor-1/YccA family protein [Spirochaetaceae bacterium]|jgi:FtsH-binding integral membrane protein|nr:Bax inhibitor-1/YccA family protein [Spirochaetaceae bacterium]
MKDYSYRGKTVVSHNGRRAFSGANATENFMASVYLWMTGALVVTGLAAILTIGPAAFNPNVSQEEAIQIALGTAVGRAVFGSQFGYIALIIAEFAVVFFLALRINKMSKTAAMLAFFAYATLNGVTLSAIFLVYSLPSIATAFFISAGMFGGMSVFGLITKKDLTKIGSICGMLLWGVIIASLVNMFLKSPGFSWVVSLIAVVVFTGLTAYDTQKLKNMQISGDGDMYAKASIFGALQLYLDFINMFLALLRLFGRSRD